MLGDLRYAFRLMARNPGFTTLAILMLALGIGANTAIFSVVDAALFKPLPYRDPERLVNILRVARPGTAEQVNYMGMTRDDLADWRAQKQIFEGIESYRWERLAVLTAPDRTESMRVCRISPGLVDFLGFKPKLGRGFTSEDAIIDNDHVILLGEGLWRRMFGADPSVIGRTVTLDDVPHTVVGVLPSQFRFPPDHAAELWLPLTDYVNPLDPGSRIVHVVARLRSALAAEQAAKEAHLAAKWLQQQKPSFEKWDARLVSVDLRQAVHMREMSERRLELLILLGAVCLVLLIACANLANLLLSRALSRQREIAIRAALGAGRVRLLRQLLIEHLLLASLGGIAAIVLASWVVSVIPKVVPARLNLFGTYSPEIDARVLAFSFVVVLATGILFGFAPAVRASSASVMSSLGVANRAAGLSVGHRRLRSAFQAVQVGLTLVMLAGMGLLLRSYVAMIQTKPGFKIESLFYVGLPLPPKAYPNKAQQDGFFDGLLERIGTHPRVVAATMGLPPPTGLGGAFVPEGAEKIPGIASTATLYHVRPDYFAVAGIPIRTGRAFGPQDGPADPPVAIIDEAAARRYWPGRSALGQRFRYSPYVPWITVVGVAGHVKTESFTNIDGDVQVYLPLSQVESAPYRFLLFRTEGDPSSVFASVRAHVRALDARVTVGRAGAVADLYDRPLAGPRFYLLVMSMFGFLALATSGVGLYALLSYSVNQRTQEIGIRMALGADDRRVRSLVVRDALGSVVAGIVFGTIVSYWLTRVLDWQLYRTTPHDPVTYAGVVLILLGVAALAAFLPARRATRIDPVEALRSE